MCVSGGKKIRFSENLACFVFVLPPFCDSPFCHITDLITFVLEELVLVSRSDVVGTWEEGKKIDANINALCYDWLK